MTLNVIYCRFLLDLVVWVLLIHLIMHLVSLLPPLTSLHFGGSDFETTVSLFYGCFIASAKC